MIILNEKWQCIYHNGNQIYFAKVSEDEVIISDGIENVRRYSMSNINGCAYNGNCLWLSTEGSNLITEIDHADNKSVIQLQAEGAVRIMRAVSGKSNCLVVEMRSEDKVDYSVFDCLKKTIVINLPITVNCKYEDDTFNDLFIEEQNVGHLLCEYITKVPPRYSDEMYDEDVLFCADLIWNEYDTVATIKRRIHLNVDYEHSDSADGRQTLISDPGLRFPLFDYYLYHWLIQKSFSSSGKYVVYYCPDISGLIIGTSEGGDVYRLFELPDEIAQEDNHYYFNDLKDILYVVDQANDIKIYSIICTNHKAVEDLNDAYNKAYENHQNLRRRRDAGDLSFWKILNLAIESCNCVPVPQNKPGNGIGEVDFIMITIETPIEGVIYYKKTNEQLASFENWSFKKTVMISRFERNLDLVFVYNAGKCSKNICLAEHTTNTYYINIKHELTPDDLVLCCDRNAAREKLEKLPTNIYATTQLGYCGTGEDYNFLLSVLEDHYCKSVVNHGKKNVNVKACINAITKLALKYYRKDAIPALRDMLILVDDSELINVIKNSCVRIAEISGPSVSNRAFRIDLHVCSNIDIDIQDGINELHFFHEVQTTPKTYYLRGLSGQLGVQVSFLGKRILIECSIEYGKDHYLSIFTQDDNKIRVVHQTKSNFLSYLFDRNNDTVILARYKGGPIEYDFMTLIPKKVQIPEFVTSIEECAFQGESETEVVIPASVQTIGARAFRYSQLQRILIPNSVSVIGVSAFENCRNLEGIVLPHPLKDISDSVLENTSIKHIEIPGTAKRIGERAFADCIFLEDVIIQDGVEVIAAGAFSGCKALTAITIPDSVVCIESRAFEMCDNIVIIGSKGSYAEKYAARNGISFDGKIPAVLVTSPGKILEEIQKKVEGIDEINERTRRIDKRTHSMDHKLNTILELQTWLKEEQQRFFLNSPSLDDEASISASIARSNAYINQRLSGANTLIDIEENKLRSLFGTVWERLLPSTQASLRSASFLWQSCLDINRPDFDYSGICISTTSALEGELRKWFFVGYQNYVIENIGNPETMERSDVERMWPKQLLDTKDGAFTLKKQESFTMGNLSYVFNESFIDPETGKKRWYIYDYLKTIVKPEFQRNPCIALNNFRDTNSFINQCENIRTSYRNRAAHPEVITRDEAENCYYQIVGRAEAYLHTTKAQGLILLLYSNYLKE